MSKNHELLLSLEDLTVFRRSLELAGTPDDDFEELDNRINDLRRKVPGELLSAFDRLTRQYPDEFSVLRDGICQGCQERVSNRLALQASRSNELAQCNHCGRLLLREELTPDYV
jgi:predicted  nucleic acid-binding Zn-ribbon protein